MQHFLQLPVILFQHPDGNGFTPEISANRCRGRAKHIIDIQLGYVIIDFEHQAQAVALAGEFTLVLLRTIPCQSALQRDGNV